jgi:hypothetical protein
VRNTELIDEIKSHLPIPAYVSRDLSNYLLRHGKYITPDMELRITAVTETGDEGGIACLLSGTNPDSFVISITLLRIKPDHPLHDKITAYQKKRLRRIFRSKRHEA